MKQDNKVRQNLHHISGSIHDVYETLENVLLSIKDDPEFCEKVIRATIKDRNKAVNSLRELRSSLKDEGML